jgi:hypothetical protein
MKVQLLALAAAAAGAKAMDVTIGSMTYTANDATIADALKVSEQACIVKGLLGDNIVWADVKNAYLGSPLEAAMKSVDDNGMYSMYSLYYESGTWAHDHLLEAIDETHKFAQMPGDSLGARIEATEKGACDHSAVKMSMRWLLPIHEAMGAPAAQKEHLDNFVASFFGMDMKCAIYARAQKRAKNYGTWGPDGTTSAASTTVLEHVIAMDAAITAQDADAIAMHEEVISANVVTVYVQAALRYLYLLDQDVATGSATSDHQGEGLAFWQAIEPIYKEANMAMDHFDMINVYYDLATAPVGTGRYCTGKEFFYSVMPMGITADMIGTFEYDYDCTAQEHSDDDSGGAATDASDASDAVTDASDATDAVTDASDTTDAVTDASDTTDAVTDASDTTDAVTDGSDEGDSGAATLSLGFAAVVALVSFL